MAPYPNRDQLVIFDADGTTIDAFHAVEQSFLRHGMAIGDLERFQKRRRLFKYWAGCANSPTTCAASSASRTASACWRR